MFGKGKLLRDGATAEAVVTAVTESVRGINDVDGRRLPAFYDLKLRVHFDDGSTADGACRVDGGFLHGPPRWVSFSEGDIVPIRFDEADRSGIIVDLPAMKAAKDARDERSKQGNIARAEQALADEGHHSKPSKGR